MKKYTLDQLVYIKNVGFFRKDAIKDMQKLEIDPLIANLIVYTEGFKNSDIISLWRDYCMDDDLLSGAFLKYVDYLLESYQP